MTELTPEQKYYRTKRILLLSLVVALVIIVLTQIQRCNGERDAITYDKIQDTLKATLADNERIQAVARSKEAEANEAKLRHAEILEEKNVLQQEVFHLTGENDRLSIIIKKAKADKDTATVFVYVDTLLLQNQLLGDKVTALAQKQHESDSLYELRLDSASSLITYWENHYNGCISTMKFVTTQLPKLVPHGKVYLTGGAFDAGPIFGGTGGITYVTKKGLFVSGKGMITTQGPGGMVEVGVLLNFKRK